MSRIPSLTRCARTPQQRDVGNWSRRLCLTPDKVIQLFPYFSGGKQEGSRFYVSLYFIFLGWSWQVFHPWKLKKYLDHKDVQDLFGNPNDFKAKGGNKAMGESLERGHVATFSLWDDVDVHMMPGLS